MKFLNFEETRKSPRGIMRFLSSEETGKFSRGINLDLVVSYRDDPERERDEV